MINSIKMTNVKGQTATQTLTGKDIIIGRNGAGKTTRMQSISLAMLGYVPGKGKTVADTFKLASDDTMAVGLNTDSFMLEREFTKTKKLKNDGSVDVKISQKLSVSPSKGETTNAQKEQRIRQELGDFPVMLDFGAFISMTDNQQRDFIYTLSGNSFSWDRNRVETEMDALLLDDELRENNPELYECMKQCIADTMSQYVDGINVQDGILAMSEYAKDRLKYWKKEKVNADGAAKKLTELKNRGQETDRDLSINLENMKVLQDQRDQVVKNIAELAAKNNVLKEKAAELAKIRAEIAQMEADQDIAEKVEVAKFAITSLENAIVEASGIEQNYDRKATDLQNDLASLNEALNIKNERLIALNGELATINAEIKANGDLLQRIADSNGFCAFSHAIPCNQNFSDFIQETHDIMDMQYELKDLKEQLLKEVTDTIKKLQESIQAKQTEQKKLEADKKAFMADVENKRKLLEQRKSELLELQGREPVLIEKRKQEAEISSYLNENPPVDLEAMEDQKNLLTGQIQSLTAVIDEQKKVRNDLLNIKANIIDSQTAEFNVLCWKQIDTAIGQKGIKGSIMKEMLDPLMEDVNSKLHEIGIPENFFFETNSDTGKEVFEFGWGSRPFDALSTGEQLLLMTALMTAMIERANPPIKVLALDNVDNLDRWNLSLVMKNLHNIGKNMDNIVLAGVVEPTEEDTQGWTVWNL